MGIEKLDQNIIKDFCGRGNTRLPPNHLEVDLFWRGDKRV